MLDLARFRVLSFDCYGTLVDWESGILGAVRPVLAARGVDAADAEILGAYVELEAAAERGPYRSYREVLGSVMAGLGERFGFVPSADELGALALSLPDWPPFPDTPEALRALARRYRLVVVSNVDDDLFAGTARRLEVRFHEVVTAQQVRSYKPALAHFHRALELLGTSAQDHLHVAQSLYHDVAPARSLGLSTVWVRRPSRLLALGLAPVSDVKPDLEVPDLRTLAALAEAAFAPVQ